MPPGTAASISASRESKPRAASIVARSLEPGPMCRSTNGCAVSRSDRLGWSDTEAPGLGGSGRLPLCRPRAGAAVLQSCLVHAVLAPERFRGGFAPSALRTRKWSETLPRGVSSTPRLPAQAHGTRRARPELRPDMRRGVPFCDRRSQDGTPRRPWRRSTRRLSVAGGAVSRRPGRGAGRRARRRRGCRRRSRWRARWAARRATPRSRARHRRWRCRRRPGRPAAGR